jgi:hypothetical protein
MEKRYVGAIPGRALSDDFKIKEDYEFCCDKLNLYVSKVSFVTYIPFLREFSIKVGRCVYQSVQYCPWCNKKLPKSLRADFFETLHKEHDLIPELFFLEKEVPEEFRSDAWWKNRGL